MLFICLFVYFRIKHYASVSLADRVIIFGSTSTEATSTEIGVYKGGNWSSIGVLKSPRYSYGAVEYDGIVMIVGGRNSQ